ncbi:MAG TPA: hypothetical protein DD381_03045 [Lentisphaeria bacterium]|nr:MAG: hypothetical protein A2X47_03205 [Lentisphaerae bacterium GWF2_38_69]HBM15310.1 hypothetical protein [Lentisphaeria bacterium]
MKKILKYTFIYIPIAVIILLIALFFLITNNYGLTKIVLPITGTALGMPIEASSAKLHLLHPYIEINDLIIGDKNKPFVKCEKLACSLGLSDLLFHNTVKINSILIKNTSITMEENKDGKWNASFMNYPTEPESESSSPLIQLDISDAAFENINFNYKDSNGLVLSVSNFNLSSPLLKNENDSSLKFNGKLLLISGKNVDIDSADISSDIKVNLNKDFIPQFLDLALLVTNLNGNIKGNDLSDKNLKLSASINHASDDINISSISLQSITGNKTTTNIMISGDAVLDPLKVNLNAKLDPIGCDTINLVTNILYGMDFGSKVSLVLNGHLSYSENVLATQGELYFSDAEIEIPNDSSQDKCLVSEQLLFDFTTNFNKKRAFVKSFKLMTSINGNDFAKVFVKKPLSFDWSGDQIKTRGDMPEIFLSTDKLDLALLKPFFDKKVTLKGKLTTDIRTQVDIANGNFATEGKVAIDNLTYKKDQIKFENIDINQKIDATLKNLSQIDISNLTLSLSQNSSKIATLSLNGNYNLNERNGHLALNISEINKNIMVLLSPNFINSSDAPMIKDIISSLGIAADSETSFVLTKDDNLDIKSLSVHLETNNSGSLSLALNSPLKINMNGKGKPLNSDIGINSSIKNFDLSRLNLFLPSLSDTKINKGQLSLDGNLSIANADFQIHSKIQANIEGLDLYANNQTYSDIDASFGSSIELNSTSLSISKIDCSVFYSRQNALKLKGEYTLSLTGSKDSSMNASLFTNETLLQALHLTGSEYQKVGEFELDGRLNFNSTHKNIIIDANLNLPQLVVYNTQNPTLSKEVNGKIDFSMSKDEKQISLKTANISLADKNIPFVNISSSGNIIFNSNTRSSLDVDSSKLDLKKLNEIYSSVFAGTSNQSGKKKISKINSENGKEPQPLDLKGINLISKIKFNDIEYGPLINAKADAVLTIKDNKITLSPATIFINNSQANIFFTMNPSYSDGYTYEFKETLKDLDINPFLKTFIEGNYSDTKGNIMLFETALEGKGFTDANLTKYFKGNMNLDCNNISLPYDITQNRILALLVLPIRLISNAMQYFPNTQMPDFLTQASNITNRIMAQKKNLDFKKGEVKLDASKGIVYVKNFDFRGGEGDLIRYITAVGRIGFDSSLMVKTNTNLSGVDIPLSIDGTIDNPQPNYSLLAALFITKNAETFLSNAGGDRILNYPAQNVTDSLTEGAKNIFNILDNR